MILAVWEFVGDVAPVEFADFWDGGGVFAELEEGGGGEFVGDVVAFMDPWPPFTRAGICGAGLGVAIGDPGSVVDEF